MLFGGLQGLVLLVKGVDLILLIHHLLLELHTHVVEVGVYQVYVSLVQYDRGVEVTDIILLPIQVGWFISPIELLTQDLYLFQVPRSYLHQVLLSLDYTLR